jgi:hypothetical protein
MKNKEVTAPKIFHNTPGIYSEFFLRLAIGFYMLIFQPPLNFYFCENSKA